MTDEKIIQLYWQREELAIEETDRKYGAYCFQIAYHILNSREDAEECLNDTWMKTWDAIPPAHPSHFQLFLAKIVRNLSFNRYKAGRTLKRGGGEITLVLDELEECLAGQSDVEAHCLAEELSAAVNRFVRSLPEREGNIFIRRYFYAESIRDISRRYQLPENRIRVLLHRTRGRLRSNLEKEGYIS